MKNNQETLQKRSFPTKLFYKLAFLFFIFSSGIAIAFASIFFFQNYGIYSANTREYLFRLMFKFIFVDNWDLSLLILTYVGVSFTFFYMVFTLFATIFSPKNKLRIAQYFLWPIPIINIILLIINMSFNSKNKKKKRVKTIKTKMRKSKLKELNLNMEAKKEREIVRENVVNGAKKDFTEIDKEFSKIRSVDNLRAKYDDLLKTQEISLENIKNSDKVLQNLNDSDNNIVAKRIKLKKLEEQILENDKVIENAKKIKDTQLNERSISKFNTFKNNKNQFNSTAYKSEVDDYDSYKIEKSLLEAQKVSNLAKKITQRVLDSDSIDEYEKRTIELKNKLDMQAVEFKRMQIKEEEEHKLTSARHDLDNLSSILRNKRNDLMNVQRQNGNEFMNEREDIMREKIAIEIKKIELEKLKLENELARIEAQVEAQKMKRISDVIRERATSEYRRANQFLNQNNLYNPSNFSQLQYNQQIPQQFMPQQIPPQQFPQQQFPQQQIQQQGYIQQPVQQIMSQPLQYIQQPQAIQPIPQYLNNPIDINEKHVEQEIELARAKAVIAKANAELEFYKTQQISPSYFNNKKSLDELRTMPWFELKELAIKYNIPVSFKKKDDIIADILRSQ